MSITINISDLKIEDVEKLNVKETIKLESNGRIINDTWDDIPEKLDNIFEDDLKQIWSNWNYSAKLHLNNKEFDLGQGNTKWFSLTRIS